MLQTRLLRHQTYQRIHKFLHEKTYRSDTILKDIIEDGRRYMCTLKEYLEYYPEDKGL